MTTSIKAVLDFFGMSRQLSLLSSKFRGVWKFINPSLSNSFFFEATWELSNKLSFPQSSNEEIPVISSADWLISTNLPSLS